MQVLILSPHRDDAAFSCGHLLLGLLQAGHSLRIANVFTVSSYAPYLEQSTADRTQQVSEVRLQEDLNFVQNLLAAAKADQGAVELIDLQWQDLPLRWQTEDEASLASCSLRTDEVEALQEALRSLPSSDLVLCPKARGGHVDHRLVCRAAQKSFHVSSLVFYDDLPYACGTLARPSLEMGDLHGMQEAWVAPENLMPGHKRDFCLKYGSQIDAEAADTMERYGLLHGGDRVAALPETLERLRSALHEAGVTA